MHGVMLSMIFLFLMKTKSGVHVLFVQPPTKEKTIEDVILYGEDEVTGGMMRGIEERQHHIPALVAGK
jgi:hypothetical protein